MSGITLRGSETRAKNLPEAYSQEGISLAVIKRQEGDLATVETIALLLAELNKFANASRTMNMEQIKLTAELILDHYYYLKLPEVEYVLRQAMIGAYGKLYETLDGFKIMEWFLEYSRERAQYVYSEELIKHDQVKEIRS